MSNLSKNFIKSTITEIANKRLKSRSLVEEATNLKASADAAQKFLCDHGISSAELEQMISEKMAEKSK